MTAYNGSQVSIEVDMQVQQPGDFQYRVETVQDGPVDLWASPAIRLRRQSRLWCRLLCPQDADDFSCTFTPGSAAYDADCDPDPED